MGSRKSGRSADDLLIRVPCGTVVSREARVLADLTDPDQTLIAAKGGRGGRGDERFKSATNRAPTYAEKGEPGEDVILDLELKLIADVGLVGYPNAGKSTFLAKVSAARPKIAAYPFTTLTPNLGDVRLGDHHFMLADIPGLIEGAHAGIGLGHEFLRHIERTRVLLFLVDAFGYENRSPVAVYRSLLEELRQHSPALIEKPRLVVMNKMDLPGSEKGLKALEKAAGKVYSISALTGLGVKPLLGAIVKAIAAAPTPLTTMVPEAPVRYEYHPELVVEKTESGFEVRGRRVERLVEMTNLSHNEAVRKLQAILKRLGVDDALEKQGVQEGDTVRIGHHEFEYQR